MLRWSRRCLPFLWSIVRRPLRPIRRVGPRWMIRCSYFLRSIVRRLLRPIRDVLDWHGFWPSVALVAPAVGLFLSWLYWEELRGDIESLSTTIRNVGLVIGGLTAIPLAVWRSFVAERQADTAQQSLLNERYQRGAEMLGSNTLSVRLGGIYALKRLAAEHPDQYHVQIMELLCAFVREPPEDNASKAGADLGEPPHAVATLREDVQAVMDVIAARLPQHLALEGEARFRLDLHGSDLRGARLTGANLVSAPATDWSGVTMAEILTRGEATDLSDAKLCSANLTLAELPKANLSSACLCRAWLGHTDLSGAKLTDASLHGALRSGPVLSGATLSSDGSRPAKGIVQSDLDYCVAAPDDFPGLSGVRDAETGEPLRWRDEPVDGEA